MTNEVKVRKTDTRNIYEDMENNIHHLRKETGKKTGTKKDKNVLVSEQEMGWDVVIFDFIIASSKSSEPHVTRTSVIAFNNVHCFY